MKGECADAAKLQHAGGTEYGDSYQHFSDQQTFGKNVKRRIIGLSWVGNLYGDSGDRKIE